MTYLRRLSSILIVLSMAYVASIPFVALAGTIAIPVGSVAAVSMPPVAGPDTLTQVQNGSMSILHTFKVVLSGMALIYLVYLGATIMMAMGQDAEIKKVRQQIIFTIVAFLFINIPWQLYGLFSHDTHTAIDSYTANNYIQAPNENGGNLFIDITQWNLTIQGGVVPFIKTILVGIAVFLFVFSAIQLMSSRGGEDQKKSSKGSMFYGVIALIFVSVIDPWVRIVYSNDVSGGQQIFSQLASFALFLAGPTVVFFLILGAYYYLTAFGSEEKAKKGKAIVINTILAILILLACYTFLLDLNSFLPWGGS